MEWGRWMDSPKVGFLHCTHLYTPEVMHHATLVPKQLCALFKKPPMCTYWDNCGTELGASIQKKRSFSTRHRRKTARQCSIRHRRNTACFTAHLGTPSLWLALSCIRLQHNIIGPYVFSSAGPVLAHSAPLSVMNVLFIQLKWGVNGIVSYGKCFLGGTTPVSGNGPGLGYAAEACDSQICTDANCRKTWEAEILQRHCSHLQVHLVLICSKRPSHIHADM